MAWKETSATAWGEIDVKIGTPKTGNGMSASMVSIGNVKEESISIETEDGTKLEWKATGGKVIDTLTQGGKISVKCKVKNLNKSNLEKFWDVTEDSSGKLQVMGMTTSNKYSVSLEPKATGAEVFEAPYCAVSMKPTFSEKDGWEQEVTFTLLSGGEGKPLFTIGQKA